MVASTRNSAGNQDGPTDVMMLGIRKNNIDPTRIGVRPERLFSLESRLDESPSFHNNRNARPPISTIGTVMAARSYFITLGFSSAVPTSATGTHASRGRFHSRTRRASTRSAMPITPAQITKRIVVGVAVGRPCLHRYRPKTL